MQPDEAWGERWRACAHPLSHKFMETACEKKSLVVLAADVPTVDGLGQLINQVGPHVAALKTHVDMVESFSMDERARDGDEREETKECGRCGEGIDA